MGKRMMNTGDGGRMAIRNSSTTLKMEETKMSTQFSTRTEHVTLSSNTRTGMKLVCNKAGTRTANYIQLCVEAWPVVRIDLFEAMCNADESTAARHGELTMQKTHENALFYFLLFLMCVTWIQIYTIARHSYFADKNLGLNRGPDSFLQTGVFVLVDRNGRIRGVYRWTSSMDISV